MQLLEQRSVRQLPNLVIGQSFLFLDGKKISTAGLAAFSPPYSIQPLGDFFPTFHSKKKKGIRVVFAMVQIQTVQAGNKTKAKNS